MIKEIKYNGFSASPSDYECAEGDLAAAVGVIPEDGALKPILPPSVVVKLDVAYKVVYLHITSSFTHYILLNTDTNVLYWLDKGDVDEETKIPASGALHQLYQFGTGVTIGSLDSVGNTLLVLTDGGMHYLLWKGDVEGYRYLGTRIPECHLSFGLQGEFFREKEVFDISYPEALPTDWIQDFSDNNKTAFTEQVLARVNKFIQEQSTESGKFIFPFFVRYAYRLYDGSLTMHSSPVLMIASSHVAPEVVVESFHDDGDEHIMHARVVTMLNKLDYKALQQEQLTQLENWSDIVKSVDIFVSQPIYTYDQSGECTGLADSQLEMAKTFCVAKHTNQDTDLSTDAYPLRYQVNTFAKLFAFSFYSPDTSFQYPSAVIKLPRKTDDTIKEDIRSCAQFYLLRSIKIEDLTTTRTVLEVDEDYLQSLVTREVMTDDYDSHDRLIPGYSFSYNQRLNITNLKKELYNDYNTGALFPFTDGFVDNDRGTSEDGTIPYTVYVFIKQDGKDIVLKGEPYELSSAYPPFYFFFYPNTNAYKAVIAPPQGQGLPFEMNLEAHSFLNGAFYFGGWSTPTRIYETPAESSEGDRIIDIPNKIYTSEVNDPFYFPLLGINTVGTGEIMGISTAAKALSQGQFGQFPLYAFSTDGVWALEVSSTGTYSARQPITRDVCINPASITQIDSAVLFATDRGIMLISGSDTICLTDRLNAEETFTFSQLPNAENLLDLFNRNVGEEEQLAANEMELLPFRTFISACRMIYDYTNQRIIVYNPAVSYAYVYSLKSKEWGMMRSGITESVNAYPNAMAMNEDAQLVDFSSSDAEGITALVVTRPLVLDSPNLFKTVDTVIQRGYLQKNHVAQVLYASNDLFHWHTVWSSKNCYLRGFSGTPYKYFRIALLLGLGRAESIYGCSVQFNIRMNNKLR